MSDTIRQILRSPEAIARCGDTEEVIRLLDERGLASIFAPSGSGQPVVPAGGNAGMALSKALAGIADEVACAEVERNELRSGLSRLRTAAQAVSDADTHLKNLGSAGPELLKGVTVFDDAMTTMRETLSRLPPETP